MQLPSQALRARALPTSSSKEEAANSPRVLRVATPAWASLPPELLQKVFSLLLYDGQEPPTDTQDVREFLFPFRRNCRLLCQASLACRSWSLAARWVDVLGLLGSPRQIGLAAPGMAQRFTSVKWLDGWAFSDEDVANLRPLRNLEILRLCGRPERQLSDSSLPVLAQFSSLTSLSLGFWGDTTTAAAASTLGSLTRLTSLDLAFSEAVTDEVLLALQPLTAMKSLDLTFCHNFSGDGLAVLASTSHITRLSLARCYQLTDSSLSHVRHLKHLEDLDLDSCFCVGEGGLRHLRDLPALTALDLSSCLQVTDEGIQSLSSLTQLKSLSLEGCEMVSFLGLDWLASACSRLETLNLRNWRAIHAPDLSSISALASVKFLSLGDPKDGWGRIKDFDLAYLSALTNLVSLEVLDGQGCNGSGLRHLPHSLRHLTLAGIKDLLPMYLFQASFIPLVTLEVSCTHVGDMGFDALRFLTSLPSLRLHCKEGSVTDAGLQGLLDLTSLQELHLEGDKLGEKITAPELDRILLCLSSHFSLTEVTIEALDFPPKALPLSSRVVQHLKTTVYA
mmetsp:Transcript_29312/g.82694  ORF Transcript_29312/g.82694 Transcript_29312/m.82694 type:complete len:563 (+) Transcript_29312:128-1816(+)